MTSWVKLDGVVPQRNEGECWIWTGPLGTDGVYGKWRKTTAHRAVYLEMVGEIEPGYEIDHLCRTPLCVNPEHLEAVTPEENRRRKYAAIVECINGHAYTESNTYRKPDGRRDCRACIRDRVRRYTAARRDA
jgi:hypothetical protein